jgi:EpsI family protein
MNFAIRLWIRFFVLVLLLIGTLGLLRGRNREEILPARSRLDTFPKTFGTWQGSDIGMSKEVLEALGPGDFLLRDYVSVSQNTSANLYVAFFPSQRTGDTIHSPKNCLPGAGWTPIEPARLWITAPDGNKLEVNRYLVAKESDRAMVLYWYQAHGHVTPSEYWAKYYLVADAIRMNRSDGAMVRVATNVQRTETIKNAEDRAVRFAQQVIPFLDHYIPR